MSPGPITKSVGDDQSYSQFDLGYDKVGKTWGIAIRIEEGYDHAPEDAHIDWWLFNEAPRDRRIRAVDKIPDLLEQLIKDAQATSRSVREKAAQAKQLAEALDPDAWLNF